MLAMILMIAALVLFIVDTFEVAARINLQSAGLACLVASILIGGSYLS